MADSSYLDFPVMDPPPGEVQDLDNPPNKNDVVVAVYTVCIVIVSIFTTLRVYSKFFLLKTPKVEDCKSNHCIDTKVQAN